MMGCPDLGSLEEGGLTWAQRVDRFEKEERMGRVFQEEGRA